MSVLIKSVDRPATPRVADSMRDYLLAKHYTHAVIGYGGLLWEAVNYRQSHPGNLLQACEAEIARGAILVDLRCPVVLDFTQAEIRFEDGEQRLYPNPRQFPDPGVGTDHDAERVLMIEHQGARHFLRYVRRRYPFPMGHIFYLLIADLGREEGIARLAAQHGMDRSEVEAMLRTSFAQLQREPAGV